MPRDIPRPHPWRSALLIFAAFVLLAIVTGLIIHFAFTPYEFIDRLPQSNGR